MRMLPHRKSGFDKEAWGYKQKQSTARKSVLSSELVAISFFFPFSLSCLNADLLIVLLQSSEIFTRLGELSFFHTLSNIPVDKGTLGVHEIELVIDAREYLSNGGGVAYHANCTHNLCKIATWRNGGGLVVDATFETCRAPIH